jgi:hypothetical protein
VLALFFWGGFYDLFFSKFVFNPREIPVGAFSGVENAKMWGSSPEMPKTGSPLAKGELLVCNIKGTAAVTLCHEDEAKRVLYCITHNKAHQ